MSKFAQLSDSELKLIIDAFDNAYNYWEYVIGCKEQNMRLTDDQIFYLEVKHEQEKRLKTSGLCNLASQVFRSEQ